MSSAGLGPEYVSELYEWITDPSSRQGGRSTTWEPQMSDINKNPVMGARLKSDTKTDWPTDRR
jgi:hypothetical protein